MTCFHFTLVSKTNNQCCDLTERSPESGLDMDSGNFLYQCFRLQYSNSWTTRLCLKFSALVCFSQPVCALSTKKNCIINLWNRSSQATFGVFDIILYSVGSLVLSLVLRSRFGTFSFPYTHQDKWQKDKCKNDCNCWNMNMFKDTVQDAVCYSLLCWSQVNFWTHGAVHIRGL